MPCIRPPLVKRRPLKLILVINNPQSIKFGLRYATYNKVNRANSTLALYYRTKVTF
jgi:hypothetical protein